MRRNYLKIDPNFVDAIKILNKLKADYWICHGTLLGIMRDRSLISWDNDIDIGTWNINNKKKIINSFIRQGFKYKKKYFGHNNLISFERNKHRIVDINFYEIDKLGKNCFQRHYAIRNLFCRLVYVLSVSKSYKGKFSSLINFFQFTSNFFKFLKKYLEKKKNFYVDAGFKTNIFYFKLIKSIKFYNVSVRIPIFYKRYFNDLYGKNWNIPDKKYYWEKNKNKKIL